MTEIKPAFLSSDLLFESKELRDMHVEGSKRFRTDIVFK